MKQTKVLTIHSGKRHEAGACEIYRVSTPSFYLAKQKGWLADWISFTEMHQLYEERSKVDPLLGERFLDMLVEDYDIFVFARICIAPREDAYESAKYLIEKMRGAGKKIVYEVDDDYTNEFRVVASGDAVTLAKWCDALVVTTPFLADTMKKKTGRPVYVAPNVLDPLFWKKPPITQLDKDKIRITLSGSKTHYTDWKVLKGVLQRIAEEHENVRILLGAFHPDYLQDIKNVEFVPALLYPQYTEMIKNSDIVLAPVDPTDKFNLGKSPIKAIEGMGATRIVNGKVMGAAVIATDNEIYRLAITNGKDGLLAAQEPEAWYSAIKSLIENVELRHRIQTQAHNTAWKHYDLSKQWRMWARAYQKVLASPQNTQKLTYEQPPTYSKIITLSDDAARSAIINNGVLQENIRTPAQQIA